MRLRLLHGDVVGLYFYRRRRHGLRVPVAIPTPWRESLMRVAFSPVGPVGAALPPFFIGLPFLHRYWGWRQYSDPLAVFPLSSEFRGPVVVPCR